MSANISKPIEAKDSDTDNNIAHSLSSNEKVEGVHNEKSFQQQVSSSDEDLVTGSTKSFGVRKNELLSEHFKTPLACVTLYLCLFCSAFIFTLDTRIRKVLTSYATNGFDNHSLLSTVSVIRSVMAAASLPFFARMSDMYGRCELLLVAVLFKAIGSLIESQAYDVQRYAAGAVIDAFGQAGIKVMLRLVMSDNSKMNWRLFAISIVTCPYIINTWISGNVVTSLTDHYSWNYSIGMWAFIFPISNIPLFVCLVWTRLKLRKQENWQELCREERESFTEMNAALEKLENRTPGGNKGVKAFLIKWYYYLKQFFWVSDIAGIVLFVLCIGLLLVPLTLAGGVTTKWKQAHIIAPLVVGFCMIPFFVLWELRCARHPIAPFPLLKDRGVLAAMTVGLFYKFVYLMPHDYMYPVLLVGMNATKAAATRIGSLNSFMIAVVGPLLGLIVVRVRRTKGFIISGICFWIIGTGMLYYYRGSNDGVHDKRFVDGVIGAMIIFGFGSGLFARTIDVSIQSCTDHEYMASVTGVYMAMFKIGSAFGDCVSGAMWTQRMYKEIVKKMEMMGVDPALAQDNKDESHQNLSSQAPGADSGDDMIISDTDTVPDVTHPPKRRLTSANSTDPQGRQLSVPASSESNMSISSNTTVVGSALRSNTFNKPSDNQMHPCTPNVIESMTNSPISDMEDQNPHQLVLPSPSASPVQSASEKRSVYELFERCMMKPPMTQGDLADLMVNLSQFSSSQSRNNIIFQLLQQVDRSSLSTFCGIIQDSLRRDLLSSLPLEISLSILSHLDYKSVLAVSRVCRSWHRLVNNTALWTSMLSRDKLLSDANLLDKELSKPKELVRDWSTPSPYLSEINIAQTLYKKRFIILQRWMNPNYEPKRISVAGHGSNIVTCLQHDEEKVITGIEGKSIFVHATKTGELLRVLRGHDGGVWALKYFSNTLVSGSTDRDVRVWNIRTGKCTHMFRGHTSTVRCLDILHPVQIGTNDNGEPIIFPKEPLLVTGSRDHNLHVWKLPLDNEGPHADESSETKVYDSKDPDNPYLVAVLVGHTQSVRSVSGYGNIIISGSYDTTVRVWDLKEGGRCKHVLEGHTDRIYSTALNFKTRRCYSGSMDSSINVWDFEKGKLLFSLEGHNSLVGLLELSDDYLVSAAADSTLRVWNPSTGENYSKLKGHSSAITCFQHDSLRIVSGSERMLKLWDVNTGKFVRDLLSDITRGIWQVRFDPDRCVAAVQKQGGESEETYIEILDFTEPLNRISEI